MNFSDKAWEIFNQSVEAYHEFDKIDTVENNPFQTNSLEHFLYKKNWIDTIQWHLEDIIRDENIDPIEALALKRRIDKSNQHRTDLVENIDDWFLNKYKDVVANDDARINSETIAWAIDRLSILALKIYHMNQEVIRKDASEEHNAKCNNKLSILLEQKKDLLTAIDQLISDIESGKVKMKTYKQMKMYNDESLNPILYQKILKK